MAQVSLQEVACLTFKIESQSYLGRFYVRQAPGGDAVSLGLPQLSGLLLLLVLLIPSLADCKHNQQSFSRVSTINTFQII